MYGNYYGSIKRKNKIKVYYKQTDFPMSIEDGMIEDYVYSLLEKELVIRTSHFLIIEQIRVFIVRGIIPYNMVEFYFINDNDHEVEVKHDNKGKFEEWPYGFCDIFDRMLDILLEFKL